ncbi:MAG TPA: hypothetical protein PK752_16515 [Accumulibacter sp.]|uniref:hypothetical protein n=2 Tax=Accumulibacter sp. TaxID=2053492 RepID=UPI002BD9FD51|nr:hypothetical protein [Accumulibacter sp.]HRD89842.1 hypothetical protein [Accumulibacter sp.]
MNVAAVKTRFDFQAAVANMLDGIGAHPSHAPDAQPLDYQLWTRAGLLSLHPFDTWLHSRFQDPRAAAHIIPGGPLNACSGKWNWHFTQPTPADVDQLERLLERLL